MPMYAQKGAGTMIKFFLILMFLALPANAYEFPLVMLKGAGDYSAHNYITDNEAECSRIINFNNVSMIRTFEKREVLIDGHINITFRTPEERSEFITKYKSFVQRRWWM